MSIPSADIVGYLATVVGTSLMLPQIVRTWRTRQMGDVAFGTILLYFFNCGLWGVYAVMIRANPMIVANGLAFLISLVLLGLKLRFR